MSVCTSDKREPFAMEVLNFIARKLRLCRIALIISLAVNVILAAVFIFR